jgi:hypothetical protein
VICLGLAKGGFVGIGLAATPILALALLPLDAVAQLMNCIHSGAVIYDVSHNIVEPKRALPLDIEMKIFQGLRDDDLRRGRRAIRKNLRQRGLKRSGPRRRYERRRGPNHRTL